MERFWVYENSTFDTRFISCLFDDFHALYGSMCIVTAEIHTFSAFWAQYQGHIAKGSMFYNPFRQPIGRGQDISHTFHIEKEGWRLEDATLR